ncbi:MAG: hypothetical protein HBSAPP03_13630 [Phycisphaerae bacterium]|nr:MAG: hypothetical protein HBSAPP03_13630 [Phycisphaerae bacterium]
MTTPGEGVSPLLCDSLLTSSDVPVLNSVGGVEVEYVFELLSDCDLNGEDDAAQIAADQLLDIMPHDGRMDYCYAGDCDADVNCDGSANGVDIEVMERAIGGDGEDYCLESLDWNGDGAANGADIEAVEVAVGGGGCPWE